MVRKALTGGAPLFRGRGLGAVAASSDRVWISWTTLRVAHRHHSLNSRVMGPFDCDLKAAADLCMACKSDTISPEVDFDLPLIPAWRTTCFGKCRCRPPRVKSFMDSGFLRAFITPMSLARLGIIGVATADAQEASSYAPARAAFRLRAASTGRTRPVSSICEPASVIRLPIAYWPQPVFQYQSAATLRSGFLTLFMASLARTIRGFRGHIVGRKEISNASPRPQEPLLRPRVLIQGSPQMGVAVP